MNITVKPFTPEYTEQCADLEKFLWKGDFEERLKRFKWTYIDCPNYSKPLSVIAVNENDEVLGFRGYFINKFIINRKPITIVQLCDTVVSDKARRMGVFQKMNNYSLEILNENNISLIINLSPSWSPYHGYKKIGFEDLADFHAMYRFDFESLLKLKVLKSIREWKKRKAIVHNSDGNSFVITQKISDEILKQVIKLDKHKRIHSSTQIDNLKWRTNRPNRNYIYAYVLDEFEVLQSFMMIKTVDYYQYDLGLYLTNELCTLNKLMKIFRREYKPAIFVAWDFAMEKSEKNNLNKLGMLSIPFINKFRKNPPALLRTLKTNHDGSLNWIIDGVDIRKVENWSISKFDLDSF